MRSPFAIKGACEYQLQMSTASNIDWRTLPFRGFAGGTLGNVGLWLPYEYLILRAESPCVRGSLEGMRGYFWAIPVLVFATHLR